MKRYKALFTAALAAALAAVSLTAVHAGETKIEFTVNSAFMKVNGVSAEIDPGKGTAPVIVNGRTLLPIRAVVEAMGGEVSWIADTKTTVLKKGEDTVELTIGSDTAYLNGKGDKLDAAPVIMNGRTMLPLRFVAESFGFKTDWDAETKSITITSLEEEKEIEYNNNDGSFTERRATDGKTYALGMNDEIYVLGKDKKPENKYTSVGDFGVMYTDDAGKLYMLTENLDTDFYELESKAGDKISFDDTEKLSNFAVSGKGSDGLVYMDLGAKCMYALDDKGNIVKKFTETGERDYIYEDKNGGKLLYIMAKDGGPEDYVAYSGGSAMLERAYFTTYLGSDGLTYTYANDYLIALDDNFEPVKEYKLSREYSMLSDDEHDDVYYMEYMGMLTGVLEGPGDEKTTLTYVNDGSDQYKFKDSKGNIYVDAADGLDKLDKNGKIALKMEWMAFCREYTDSKGEVYTLILGDDHITLLMPSGQTIDFQETYG